MSDGYEDGNDGKGYVDWSRYHSDREYYEAYQQGEYDRNRDEERKAEQAAYERDMYSSSGSSSSDSDYSPGYTYSGSSSSSGNESSLLAPLFTLIGIGAVIYFVIAAMPEISSLLTSIQYSEVTTLTKNYLGQNGITLLRDVNFVEEESSLSIIIQIDYTEEYAPENPYFTMTVLADALQDSPDVLNLDWIIIETYRNEDKYMTHTVSGENFRRRYYEFTLSDQDFRNSVSKTNP